MSNLHVCWWNLMPIIMMSHIYIRRRRGRISIPFLFTSHHIFTIAHISRSEIYDRKNDGQVKSVQFEDSWKKKEKKAIKRMDKQKNMILSFYLHEWLNCCNFSLLNKFYDSTLFDNVCRGYIWKCQWILK